MHLEFRIDLDGLAPSSTLETVAREKATKLGHDCPGLLSCQIGIGRLPGSPSPKAPFVVRIAVAFAGHELSLTRVDGEDPCMALRHAFDSLRRELESAGPQRREQARPREPVLPPAGTLRGRLEGEVVYLDADERLGFIRTREGVEYCFGPESLADAEFDQVPVGARVEFVPELAWLSRQALRVRLGGG